MPGLDVSFILRDARISTLFDVRRRMETVGSNGRTSITTQTFANIRGVVLPTDPSDVVRSDSSTIVQHAIEINAPFVFRSSSTGFQPDEITWAGRKYLVDKIYPFSHFGQGHQRVLCVSVTATDPPQF